MSRRTPSMWSSTEPRRNGILAWRREPPPPRRFGSMADVMRRSRSVAAPSPADPAGEAAGYDAILCDICGSGDRDGELLLCDRCDRGCHTFCVRPIVAKVPVGPWFCPDCAPDGISPRGFPMKQTKILDFFQVQKDDKDGETMKCRLRQEMSGVYSDLKSCQKQVSGDSHALYQEFKSRDKAMVAYPKFLSNKTKGNDLKAALQLKQTNTAFGFVKCVILILILMVTIFLLVKFYAG